MSGEGKHNSTRRDNRKQNVFGGDPSASAQKRIKNGRKELCAADLSDKLKGHRHHHGLMHDEAADYCGLYDLTVSG